MEAYYKLRVTHTTVTFQQVLDVITQYCTTYAYCHEGASDNPHTHWYLEPTCKAPTLRNRLRKLGLEGNKCYSLLQLDERYPIAYLSYMSKEGNFNFSHLPQDIVDRAKAHQEEILIEMKEKKKAKRRVIDILEELVLAEIPEEDFQHSTIIEKVAPIVLQYHLDKALLIRPHAIDTYVLTIILKHSQISRKEFIIATCQRITNHLSIRT